MLLGSDAKMLIPNRSRIRTNYNGFRIIQQKKSLESPVVPTKSKRVHSDESEGEIKRPISDEISELDAGFTPVYEEKKSETAPVLLSLGEIINKKTVSEKRRKTDNVSDAESYNNVKDDSLSPDMKRDFERNNTDSICTCQDSHSPSRIPPTERKKYSQRRCVVCRKHGASRDTRYYCETCNVALCKTPCFEEYHCYCN